MDSSSSLTLGTEYSQSRSESFIDEALVQSILRGGAYRRQLPEPSQLVLSSSEDDFAGWNLPVQCSFPLTIRKSA